MKQKKLGIKKKKYQNPFIQDLNHKKRELNAPFVVYYLLLPDEDLLPEEYDPPELLLDGAAELLEEEEREYVELLLDGAELLL
jgi:hypothetical protein